MQNPLLQQIDAIAKEKGVEPEIIIGAVQDAIEAAARKRRHVVVTGPVACTEGEKLHLRVTVTQRSTGAVAEGRTLDTCIGDSQQWKVHASTQGKASF